MLNLDPASVRKLQHKNIPIDTRGLFEPLEAHLMNLLQSLQPEDWHKPTVASAWTVKDVVSHMLDTKLRVLSIQRDRHFGEQPPEIENYRGLVKWINKLNNDWVQASRRLSPDVLILLHASIGKQVTDYYRTLDPWDQAIFAVDWAGEAISYNWMHLAREYTEYWHHQQQIRDATEKPGIMTKAFFYPVMDTFMQALPHTFKAVAAENGTLIRVTVSTGSGGSWYLHRCDGVWQLIQTPAEDPGTHVILPPDLAWKVFSKSLRAGDVLKQVQIEGNRSLGLKVLDMVSVIA